MALFWLTRWGRSECEAAATNDAIVACGYVAELRRQVLAWRSDAQATTAPDRKPRLWLQAGWRF